MRRPTGVVIAFGALVARTGVPAPGGSGASKDKDEVVVKHDPENRETGYTIVPGDCRIAWTVYRTEANRGAIRHRSDCGPAPAEQAPPIGQVLRKVMAADAEAAGFRTLSWGRLTRTERATRPCRRGWCWRPRGRRSGMRRRARGGAGT
jgi:hypothetical protein